MEIPTSLIQPGLELPADLRDRFGSRELASFAIEAVHRVKPGSSTFQHNGQIFSESWVAHVGRSSDELRSATVFGVNQFCRESGMNSSE